jgi:(4S)-4-hydroxy-5-phosphonooxypentane-2,3-dione isomerase
MAVALAVRMVIGEGNEERAWDAVSRLVTASRREPGCRIYQPHRDPHDARVMFLYEQYEDQAALDAHGASEHFETIAKGELFPLLESRDRGVYEAIEP